MSIVRHDWTFEEIKNLNEQPLFHLMAQAHAIHSHYHNIGEIQTCSLISVKTGGCQEDCKYCAQSSYYKTALTPQALMPYEKVLEEAKKAKVRGVTRICLGAAWREVRENKPFEDILKMIAGIRQLGLEVCCTLGMLKESHARKLKTAGLYAYNHNLDTSENYYSSITTTRTYKDRLDTLKVVRNVGLTVCCGGILGLGEESTDRLQLLHTLATMNPHPESVPINRLEAIAGTPFENFPRLSFWEMLRIICLARITMPQTMVRLSAGRLEMSFAEQTLCFLAGANSIFLGEKLLTVANHPVDKDEELFQLLGLKKQPPYVDGKIL